MNFKALKIFSVSWLNLDFVAFLLLVKKTHEKYGKIRLKAFHFQCRKCFTLRAESINFFNRVYSMEDKCLFIFTEIWPLGVQSKGPQLTNNPYENFQYFWPQKCNVFDLKICEFHHQNGTFLTPKFFAIFFQPKKANFFT